MVLLDLQKAFDTVDHAILLKKLSGVGVDELSICWFRSYLTGSVQVTDVDGTMYVAKGITCGVPQGSILGPLLFLLYITDMSAAVKCKLLLYAGKTQQGQNCANVTLLILYVMELSLNQSKPSPI